MNEKMKEKQKELEALEKKITEVKNQMLMLTPSMKDNFNLLQKYKLNIFEQIGEELESVDYADAFNEFCMVDAVEVAIVLRDLEEELEHWSEER